MLGLYIQVVAAGRASKRRPTPPSIRCIKMLL
jgi:hypothetical protein